MSKQSDSYSDSNSNQNVGKEAPPMNERPRCRFCGKRLRPNYNHLPPPKNAPKKSKLVYKVKVYDVYGNEGRAPVTKEEHGYKDNFERDAKGRPCLRVPVRPSPIRVWRGTYGAYGDGTFCGTRCGRDYGLSVYRMLVHEGREVVCYTRKGAHDERKKTKT